MARQPTDGHHQNKARDILDEMSQYRLDPTSIKIADPTPRARGGQSVVIIGTLTLRGTPKILQLIPPNFERLLPKFLEKFICDESNEVHFEAIEKMIPRGTDELILKAFKGLRSEALKKDMTGKLKELAFEKSKELVFGKKVAVKQFEWPRDETEQSARDFKSFVNELSLMASFSHPNIIEFLGFVENTKKGDAWIVLPWEANGNVREFLQSGEWLIPERISLIHDTAQGLEYLHSRVPPICHGDLKSLNILVNSSHRAIITDFGSARIKRSVSSEKEENQSEMPRQVLESTSPHAKFDPSTLDFTLTGPAFSLRWTAPEVLNNGMQDLPSDMWAMGWICWEIITGRVPFEELHLGGAIIKHTVEGKLPLIREDSQLSHVLVLCSLMSDCWLSDPGKRISVSAFQRKTAIMPFKTPSGSASDGQKARSAGLLVELGRMYELQSDKKNAEAQYLSAIDVATRTKDDLGKASALQCLGGIHGANSNFGEAESSYKQAQEICSRVGNSLGTANALGGLGEIYRMQSKHEEAEKAFGDAHEAHFRAGSKLGTGNALVGLGNTYQAQSRYREAEKAFKAARETHSRIGNDLGTGNALFGLGNTYLVQSKDLEAEKAFSQALEIHSRIGNGLGVASAFDGLGQVRRAQAQNQEAEVAFKDAREIHSRIGNDLGTGNALVGLGNTYLAQSRSQEAEKAFRDAHEVHSRIGNDPGAANALDGLGELYRAQSKNQEAEKAFNEAYEIHSRSRNDLGMGNALLGLGNTYLAQSRNLEAEKAFSEALEIHCRIVNGLGVASAFDGLGQVRRAQSQDQEAERVRRIHSLISDNFGAGNASRSLGIVYGDRRTCNEAEPVCYHQVPASHDRANDGHGDARALLALGKLHHTQHRYLEAEETITKALAIATNISHLQGQATTSQLLAQILRSYSKRSERMDDLIEAEVVYAQLGDHVSRAEIVRKIGDLQVEQGMYTEAEESYHLAQAIYLSISNAGGVATSLRQLGELCIYQDRHAEAEGYFTEARLGHAVISDENGEAKALDGLTAVHALRGKFGDAKATCMEACEIYRRIGRPLSEICVYVSGMIHVLEENPL